MRRSTRGEKIAESPDDHSSTRPVEFAAAWTSAGHELADEAATEALAGALAPWLRELAESKAARRGADAAGTRALLISLEGELGAGKTTLVRALLRQWGYAGTVKSPTYTLVETYPLNRFPVAHMDLYRVVEPEELDLMGFDELVAEHDLVLIEWAGQGGDRVPQPDVILSLDYVASGGRRLRLEGS